MKEPIALQGENKALKLKNTILEKKNQDLRFDEDQCKHLVELKGSQERAKKLTINEHARKHEHARLATNKNIINWRAPLHEECPKHHEYKGDPRVTSGTCGTIGERAPMILMR